MKSLGNYIEESLLSDINTTISDGDELIKLNNRIISSDLSIRVNAFNDLYNEFISNNIKQIKSKSKIKTSRKYFIGFYTSPDNKINTLHIFYRTGTNTYTSIYIYNESSRSINNFYTVQRGIPYMQLSESMYLDQTPVFETPEYLEPIIKKIIMFVNNG